MGRPTKMDLHQSKSPDVPASIRSSSLPENRVRPSPVKDRYDPQGRLWPVLKAFLFLYRALCVGRIRVSGRRNIRPGSILVSNHAFVSDAFILAIVLGRLHALAQVEAFTLPFFGWLLARAGQIPVATGRGAEALARAADQLANGKFVLIYPEGRLSHGGQLLQAKTGAARLSLSTQAPLLPIAFYVPPGYGRMFRGRQFNRPTAGVWQIGGPCTIVIGEAWWPFAGRDTASEEEIRSVADESLARVQALLEHARLEAV